MFAKNFQKSIKILVALTLMFVFLASCSKKSVESIIKKNGYKILMDGTFGSVSISSKVGTLNYFFIEEGEEISFVLKDGSNGGYSPEDQIYTTFTEEVCQYNVEENKVAKGKCSQTDIDEAEELGRLYIKFVNGLGVSEEELYDFAKENQETK